MAALAETLTTPYEPLALTHPEVGGIPVKLIASNIRHRSINWEQMEVAEGVGQEEDLVVVEAVSNTGTRNQVENQYGRDERVYQEDRFLAVLANRHTGTSESGDVPIEGIAINEDTELHLLAAGGIVGRISGIPPHLRQEPFRLKPLGLVYQDGQKVNLADLYGPWDEAMKPSAPMIVIFGTSAEVGKTTTAAALIRTIKRMGLQVAGSKFAGTGRMRDILSLRDAGAYPAMDFPDVGLASTYTSAERFTPAVYTLFNRINSYRPHVIITEAGGDPIEANIPTFLANQNLMQNVKALVLVAGDVMGMMGAYMYLRQYTDVPVFLTDPKDRNPVTTRQRVAKEVGLPIFNSLNPKEVEETVSELIKIIANQQTSFEFNGRERATLSMARPN